MKNNKYFLTLLIVTAFLGASLYFKNNSSNISTQSSDKEESVQHLNQNRIFASTNTKTPVSYSSTEINQSQITSNDIKSLNAARPFKHIVEKEMKSNPHSPPSSLMIFAEKLGPLLERAYKDENAASTLMRTLDDCAHDETVINAGRALCVLDAEKIGIHQPKMRNQANDLRASMSSEIQKMLDTNDSMIKR